MLGGFGSTRSGWWAEGRPGFLPLRRELDKLEAQDFLDRKRAYDGQLIHRPKLEHEDWGASGRRSPEHPESVKYAPQQQKLLFFVIVDMLNGHPRHRNLSGRPTMNVSLTPELERLIAEKVASGMYSSRSEVVREGLRLLAERDQLLTARLDRLREEVGRGLEQAVAGHLVPGEEVFAEIEAMSRRRRERGD